MVLDVPRDEVLAAYKAADLFVFGSQVEALRSSSSRRPPQGRLSSAQRSETPRRSPSGPGAVSSSPRSVEDGKVTASPEAFAAEMRGCGATRPRVAPARRERPRRVARASSPGTGSPRATRPSTSARPPRPAERASRRRPGGSREARRGLDLPADVLGEDHADAREARARLAASVRASTPSVSSLRTSIRDSTSSTSRQDIVDVADAHGDRLRMPGSEAAVAAGRLDREHLVSLDGRRPPPPPAASAPRSLRGSRAAARRSREPAR